VVPNPGDLVRVDGRASVQFHGERALTFRVTAVCGKLTYHGWAWLAGYVIDQAGDGVERREIFVQPDGLRLVASPASTTDRRSAPRMVRGRRV